MKKILGIVVLGLLLSGSAFSDSISDFEIEGMSIGESALNYFSKSELKSNKQNWYKKNNYSTSTINGNNISYKTNDKKYLIEALETGELIDIDKCLEKLPKEFNSLKDIFGTNIEIIGPTRTKHWADKSNNSWYEGYYFEFPNKDTISIECYNWSDEITSKKGWKDNLRFIIRTNEFNDFLISQNK